MQIPSLDPDTTFDQLLQDLPPETQALVREFKAFTRARKIQSVAQLLRAVLLFAGLDWTRARSDGQPLAVGLGSEKLERPIGP